MKSIMIQNNIRNKKKANYKTTIYQDRYVSHSDTDSFGG